MNSELLIYTPKITKRVKYILNLIFCNLLNTKYNLTSSIDEYSSFEGIKINYSQQPTEDGIFIYADNLLFETGIKEQNLSFINYNGSKAFFPNYDKRSAFPFDPFAASFYLVTRYEEYLPYLTDKHDRFDAPQSIAYKYHFLQKPIVNIWVNNIAEIIKQKYPSFKYRKNHYEFIPTIDIDLYYAYRLKGLFQNHGRLH